jgi:hypothetical protein
MNDTSVGPMESANLETVEHSKALGQPVESLDKGDIISLDLFRWCVNLFIMFHVAAIVSWNLPSSALQETVTNFFKPYVVFTGVWQSWSMFSPNPVSTDTYIGAVVHYHDGTTKPYTFPRMSLLGITAKYKQERWRKFIENTSTNSQMSYWPYLARYAALVNNPAPRTNPPVAVDLYRYSRYIPINEGPPPRFLKTWMLTEHVIAMPSKQPLITGSYAAWH